MSRSELLLSTISQSNLKIYLSGDCSKEGGDRGTKSVLPGERLNPMTGLMLLEDGLVRPPPPP